MGDRDARDMFPTLVRAVRETEPRLVLVENVKGLLRPKFAWYLRYILAQLAHPSMAIGGMSRRSRTCPG